MRKERVNYIVKKTTEKGIDSKAFLVWLQEQRPTRYCPTWVESMDGHKDKFIFSIDFYDGEMPDDYQADLDYNRPG